MSDRLNRSSDADADPSLPMRKTAMSYLEAVIALQDHETLCMNCASGGRCPTGKELLAATMTNMKSGQAMAQSDPTALGMRDNLGGSQDRSNDWRR